MKLGLAFAIEHDGWGNPEPLCVRAVQAVLDQCGQDLPAAPWVEVSMVLADDEAVRELNRDWRGKDSPTNVLSFPAWEDEPLPDGAPLMLGDIILAFETCQHEAARDQIALADHLAHLVVHGTLHLLGYDHVDEEDAVDMEALEISILADLGVANPYKDDGHE